MYMKYIIIFGIDTYIIEENNNKRKMYTLFLIKLLNMKTKKDGYYYYYIFVFSFSQPKRNELFCLLI